MEMKPVTSSQVSSIGYDAETRIMHVQFVKGALYEYDDVPEDTHQALVNAPSIGRDLRGIVAGLTYRRL